MSNSWLLPPWSAKYPLEFISQDMLDTTAPQNLPEQNFLDDFASAKSTVVGSIQNIDPDTQINPEIIENLTTNVEPWDITERHLDLERQRNKRTEKKFKTYKKSTSKPLSSKREKYTQEQKELKKVKPYHFKPKKESSKFESAANYDAIDVSQSFGLIDNNSTFSGCMLFTIHSPKKTPTFKPGDVLSIVKRSGEAGDVKIRFVGRSKYVQPGKSIRSMTVGLSTEEWKRLTN